MGALSAIQLARSAEKIYVHCAVLRYAESAAIRQRD